MADMIKIDHTNLSNYLKNKAPYVFVDTAEVIPGKSAIGVKNFTNNEWFFACHFPDNPIVPGVFTLEAIMQTAALAVYTDDSLSIDYIFAKKFREVDLISGVYPGEQILTETFIDEIKRGIVKAHGCAHVERNNRKVLVCKANFEMIIPQIVRSISPSVK